jgi:ribonucleoside-diphosphate reductase beta chain
MQHTTFATTTRRLRRDSPPMILFEKAKRLGIWNPSEIDFSQDLLDWPRFTDDQREATLQLTALFQAGEEAVTLDLLPLISYIAKQGRIEEEIFLTAFLWEEAKHVDFFSRFLTEVVPGAGDLSRYHEANYRHIFYDALPAALDRLRADPTPESLARASTTYNLVIEGMIAETGYHAYFLALDTVEMLPGMRQGITLLKQDEARHIAYGIYLLSRLIAEDPRLWDVVQETMNDLIGPVMAMIEGLFSRFETPPFGADLSLFLEYAANQAQKRLDRIDRSRRMSLEEIENVTRVVIEENDA